MFDLEFFPTPKAVALQMLEGYELAGKVVLEPSAGKGDLIDAAKEAGAEVIACEKNEDLRTICATKCKVLAADFFTLKAEDVSHVDIILMNPPFSNAEKHILHAYDIAPAGCVIIALCNLNTVKRPSYEERARLANLINENGGAWEDIGTPFKAGERFTGVEVAMIKFKKAADDYKTEFEGFFMEEDPEEEQENALMSYNVVRDLVNRYVAAVKLFDEQLNVGAKMHALTNGFYKSELAFSVSEDNKPKSRGEFKKDLQRSGWHFIFDKMNMQKIATRGLREDINAFVEKQTQVPFTMRNIYRMLEIVIGTTGQRMDKALLEVFDKLTQRYDENRYNFEGWKTNSHYLINEKFILPYVARVGYNGKMGISYNGHADIINDMIKALCYLTGSNYDELPSPTLEDFVRQNEPAFGKWYSWGFFEIKGYKKGTMHFKFNSRKLWEQFNQRIAKIKGYPLPEAVKRSEKDQAKQDKKDMQSYARTGAAKVLFEFDIK